MKRIFKNIGRLIHHGQSPLSPLRKEAINHLEIQNNCFLVVENGIIVQKDIMANIPDIHDSGVEMIDVRNATVFPTWCDSHTHTVFAKKRHREFEMRIKGMTYQQIAEAGGGILNSAKALGTMSHSELLNDAKMRITEMIKTGHGALEIKSGYGLSTENEIKILQVIQELKQIAPIPIRATFLGAHAIPKQYASNREAYIQLIINEMLPEIAKQQLADYCDVFCETGYFSPEETERILQKASSLGLRGKIHTNQFTSIGGIEAAIRHKAISVDHLEVTTLEEIKLLAKSETMATILPIAPFYLNDPYPAGRQLIDEGAALALATDFNPGSAPTSSMPFAIALACIKCGLAPAEAFNAATINGAFAMGLGNKLGTLEVGKLANFCIASSVKDIAEIPYSPCSQLIDKVIINGREFDGI